VTILALDGGLGTCGYAVVRKRTARVLELGTLTSTPAEGVIESTDRARRIVRLVETLRSVARKYGCDTVAAEAMSFGGPPKARFRMAVSLCLFWGAIAGLAVELNASLLEVQPKQWQHAVLGCDGKVDYEVVFAALGRFVDGQVSTLLSIPRADRNHALDAVGVGVFASLVPGTTSIRTATA
jgi:Holliday junction resolvasome RuvABC endonuclease subunit